MVRGTVDEWALRLPSVVAILPWSWLFTAMGGAFFSRFGAFFCACVWSVWGKCWNLAVWAKQIRSSRCFWPVPF